MATMGRNTFWGSIPFSMFLHFQHGRMGKMYVLTVLPQILSAAKSFDIL
jgi:hypothetical protein